jgi:hypothetical protein
MLRILLLEEETGHTYKKDPASLGSRAQICYYLLVLPSRVFINREFYLIKIFAIEAATVAIVNANDIF